MSVSTALAPVTMREALSDPALLGAVLAGDSLAALARPPHRGHGRELSTAKSERSFRGSQDGL